MKQKRLYEEARIDVVQLSSKTQLLAGSESVPVSNTQNFGLGGYNGSSTSGHFTETI